MVRMATVTIGVDLGGTKIQTVAVADGEVVGEARHATPQADAQAVMGGIVAAAREALGAAGNRGGEVRAIGIGTPGTVDPATGNVSNSANVAGFLQEVPLGSTVSAAFDGVPVVVDNDVRAATMGEFRRGAGRPYRDLMGVFVGTGVGGGLILGGTMHRGRGGAGEIGHTVVKPGGRRCVCGMRGCLEAYAGRQSIERVARRRAAAGTHTMLFKIMEAKGRDRVTSSVVADALERGDELTHKLVNEAVDALGLGLANAQNLLDLEAIILGGGLGDRLGDQFVQRVGRAMFPHLHLPDRPPVVLQTELRDLSGAVGAAVVAGG
jgi:glucokinase